MLDNAEIPVFTAECVIGNTPQLIQNPTVLTRSNSALFYKEQLFNLLEPQIPEQYTKLVFMDADIVFSSPDWVDLVSQMLETIDLLQPFRKAKWLSPNLKDILYTQHSFSYETRNGFVKGNSHPGFVWGIRRDYFRKIDGFFDKAIIGSGDTMFAYSLFILYEISYKFVNNELKKYYDKKSSLPTRVGWLDMEIYHLNHGSLKNRSYNDRHRLLALLKVEDWGDIIETKEMYELKDRSVNDLFKTYFLTRNEDSIIE
jgi:hypothetical protein